MSPAHAATQLRDHTQYASVPQRLRSCAAATVSSATARAQSQIRVQSTSVYPSGPFAPLPHERTTGFALRDGHLHSLLRSNTRENQNSLLSHSSPLRVTPGLIHSAHADTGRQNRPPWSGERSPSPRYPGKSIFYTYTSYTTVLTYTTNSHVPRWLQFCGPRLLNFADAPASLLALIIVVQCLFLTGGSPPTRRFLLPNMFSNCANTHPLLFFCFILRQFLPVPNRHSLSPPLFCLNRLCVDHSRETPAPHVTLFN